MACKCDQHPAHREVDPVVVEQKAKSFLGDVRVFQSSAASPETQRECLTYMTRAIIAAKRRECMSYPHTAKYRLSDIMLTTPSTITSLDCATESQLLRRTVCPQRYVAQT